MEPASAVEGRRSVECRCAVERRATVKRGTATESRACTAESLANPTAPVEPGAAVERAPIPPMEPRPGADEDAASKVVRPVVTVRSARVRVISIVAVRAVRSRPDIRRTDPNTHRADAHPHLRMRCPDPCREHQKPQHKYIL
jgi:hypothetical protein